MYELLSGVWTQIGGDIDGEANGDWSGGDGAAVSMSSDGTYVAIGATRNDGNGSNSGHVRVYELQSNEWVQVGGDLDGEAEDDEFGKAVSLSFNGSIVAIGASNNDGNGANAGHVRVFEFNSEANDWTQLGEDIDGEAAGDQSGFYAVSLSADGSLVAIGAKENDGNGSNSGHVRVYKLQSDEWVQVGGDIDGESGGDHAGRSVSMSADGSHVAIGSFLDDVDAGNEAGSVRVFEIRESNGSKN